MIIVGGPALAQKAVESRGNLLLNLASKFYYAPSVEVKKPLNSPVIGAGIVAPDFYSHHLGFFCRQEIRMDKITAIPFRFRLGSVEQCNWLEGKSKK